MSLPYSSCSRSKSISDYWVEALKGHRDIDNFLSHSGLAIQLELFLPENVKLWESQTVTWLEMPDSLTTRSAKVWSSHEKDCNDTPQPTSEFVWTWLSWTVAQGLSSSIVQETCLQTHAHFVGYQIGNCWNNLVWARSHVRANTYADWAWHSL